MTVKRHLWPLPGPDDEMPEAGNEDFPLTQEEGDEENLVVELRIKDVGQLMQTAHKELLVRLLAKLKAGTATHQEAAVLRNLLRDNGMVISPWNDRQAGVEAGPRPELPELPDLEDPAYED